MFLSSPKAVVGPGGSFRSAHSPMTDHGSYDGVSSRKGKGSVSHRGIDKEEQVHGQTQKSGRLVPIFGRLLSCPSRLRCPSPCSSPSSPTGKRSSSSIITPVFWTSILEPPVLAVCFYPVVVASFVSILTKPPGLKPWLDQATSFPKCRRLLSFHGPWPWQVSIV